jgi:flagellar basal-body rod protein FlgG
MALTVQPLYVLASGGERALKQLDVTTNNIANISTPGFKRILMRELSQPVSRSLAQENILTFPRFKDTKVITEQGVIRKTDSPFDFAIHGEGFFQIKVKGSTLLTRNGHFFLNSEGFLVDQNGNKVLDEIQRPIKIDPNAPFTVTDDGAIYQNGEKVAKISITMYDTISAVGEGYYKPNGKQLIPEFKLLRGFLEMSNVNPIKEMINLIQAQRRFEIYGNLIRSLDALNHRSNEIGKV